MMSKLAAACPFVSFGETMNCRGKSCQEDKDLSLSQNNIKASTNNNNCKVVVCAGRRTMLTLRTYTVIGYCCWYDDFNPQSHRKLLATPTF